MQVPEKEPEEKNKRFSVGIKNKRFSVGITSKLDFTEIPVE